MTRLTSGWAVFVALFSFALPAVAQQYYLYSPKQVNPDAKVSHVDKEVLVTEIVVKKGDTLSGISKSNSGRSSYYPQILLFNDIKNPHMIRVGDTIRVPVRKEASSSTDIKSIHKNYVTAETVRAKTVKDKAVNASAPVTIVKSSGNRKAVSALNTSKEQQLFDQGFKAYRSGDCRLAIEKFDGVLTTYSNSPLAADASLYKADCLLKMSGQ